MTTPIHGKDCAMGELNQFEQGEPTMAGAKISSRAFDLTVFIVDGEARDLSHDGLLAAIMDRFGDLKRYEVAQAIEFADFILRDRAQRNLEDADALDALYQAVEAESEMP